MMAHRGRSMKELGSGVKEKKNMTMMNLLLISENVGVLCDGQRKEPCSASLAAHSATCAARKSRGTATVSSRTMADWLRI